MFWIILIVKATNGNSPSDVFEESKSPEKVNNQTIDSESGITLQKDKGDLSSPQPTVDILEMQLPKNQETDTQDA